MTIVGPVAPPLPRRPTPGANAGSIATVVRLSQAAAALATDTILRAVVARREPGNVVHLSTDHGALTIRTGIAMDVGDGVTLQIRSSGNQWRAVILAVDRRNLKKPASAKTRPGDVIA